MAPGTRNFCSYRLTGMSSAMCAQLTLSPALARVGGARGLLWLMRAISFIAEFMDELAAQDKLQVGSINVN